MSNPIVDVHRVQESSRGKAMYIPPLHTTKRVAQLVTAMANKTAQELEAEWIAKNGAVGPK